MFKHTCRWIPFAACRASSTWTYVKILSTLMLQHGACCLSHFQALHTHNTSYSPLKGPGRQPATQVLRCHQLQIALRTKLVMQSWFPGAVFTRTNSHQTLTYTLGHWHLQHCWLGQTLAVHKQQLLGQRQGSGVVAVAVEAVAAAGVAVVVVPEAAARSGVPPWIWTLHSLLWNQLTALSNSLQRCIFRLMKSQTLPPRTSSAVAAQKVSAHTVHSTNWYKLIIACMHMRHRIA